MCVCVCLSVVASRVEVGFKAASAVCKGPPLSGKRRRSKAAERLCLTKKLCVGKSG